MSLCSVQTEVTERPANEAGWRIFGEAGAQSMPYAETYRCPPTSWLKPSSVMWSASAGML